MAEQDSSTQGDKAQEPVPYVTADMAWEMSKRAAAEAREDALREVQAQPQNQQTQQNNRNVQNNRSVQNNRDDDYEDRGKRRRRRDDDDEDEDLIGFSPKLVKQLQTTVGVFNTLKDFSSNPMQKAIEERIGSLAAGIIENAFTSPRGPPPKRDMVDTILNSQMAFGLGQGLGSRAPELVESLSKSFGREKAAGMIDGMIGKYSGGGQKKLEHSDSDKAPGPEPSRSSPVPQKSEDQSNIELLLSLDPNNPEHVAAYAESQGGISIDVARKMLMIHQDDIIKRMKSQGADTSTIEMQRGSRVGQDNPSQHNTIDQGNISTPPPQQSVPIHRVDVVSPYQVSPVQQPPPIQQPQQPSHIQQTYPTGPPPPVQQTYPVEPPPPIPQVSPSYKIDDIREDMQYMEPGLEDVLQGSQQPDQEYAEYKDIGQQENNSNPNISNNQQNQQAEKSLDPNSSNNQQAEMMKVFAEDIGKVMGEMINKIETLNNTVFTLQNEVNEVKKQKIQTPPGQPLYQKPPERRPQEQIPLEQRHIQEPTSSKDFFPDNFDGKLEEAVIPVHDLYPENIKDIEKSPPENVPDFRHLFPEKVQSAKDFEKELEEETKRAMQPIRQENICEMPKLDKKDEENIGDVQKLDKKDEENVGDIQKLDKKDNEIKITKKPIMSMVNKKKISYSIKQKVDDTQPEDKSDEGIKNKEDSDTSKTGEIDEIGKIEGNEDSKDDRSKEDNDSTMAEEINMEESYGETD